MPKKKSKQIKKKLQVQLTEEYYIIFKILAALHEMTASQYMTVLVRYEAEKIGLLNHHLFKNLQDELKIEQEIFEPETLTEN